jgi:O-antigen ligase
VRPDLTAQPLHDHLAGARLWLVLAALAVVPIVFDPGANDAFGLPKGSVLLVGSLALVAVAAVECLERRRFPRPHSALELSVLVLVAWTAVTTLTGTTLHAGVLGAYGTYDGLLTTVAYAAVFFAVAATPPQRVAWAAWALLAAGGVVAVLGALELAGRAGGRVTGASLSTTLGNPNHTGAFLAIVLPLAVAAVAVERRRPRRAVVVVLTVTIVLVLGASRSTGAWLAAAVGMTTLAALTVTPLRRRPLVVVGAVGALVAAVPVAGLALTTLGRRPFGDGGTSHIRVEIWRAAGRMASSSPLVGVGPDQFRTHFPRFQGRELVSTFGPDEVVGGAHNLILELVSTRGGPGLAAFAAVVVLAGLRSAADLRTLSERERRVPDGRPVSPPREWIVPAAAVAAASAYLVQASFNVHQVALGLSFWALLGVLAAPAGDGRPESARPARTRGVPVAGAAVLAALVVAVAMWNGADPWRADRAFGDALRLERRAGALDPAAHRTALRLAQARLEEAVRLDPRRSLYVGWLGRATYRAATATRPPEPTLLHASRQAYARAVGLEPTDAGLHEGRALTLLALERIEPGSGHRAAAVEALEDAVAANPWQPRYSVRLARALIDAGDLPGARRVAEHALRYSPGHGPLARIASALGS